MLRIFIRVIVCLSFLQHVKSDCIMYGICNHFFYKQPCNATGQQPKPMDHKDKFYEEAQTVLEEICPQYASEKNKRPHLCCNAEQVVYMAKSLELTTVFERCPTCVRNIKNHICEMTCSPVQHKFMNVKKMSENPGNRRKEHYVKEINLHLPQTYMETTYASCKDIIDPNTMGPVMDSACGDWTSAYCNTTRWFESIGNHPLAPLAINYISVLDDPIGIIAKGCNDSYEGLGKCNCADCISNCIGNKFPTILPEITLFHLNQNSWLVIAVVFVAAIISIAIYLCRRQVNVKISLYSGFLTQRYKNVETLEIFFEWWSGQIIKYGLTTIVASVSIIIMLTFGVFNIKIITDPSDIWAGSNVQSKIEKDYFEQHFQPNLRTEQVIIKTVGTEPFKYESTGGDIIMGPIFNETVLQAIFKLKGQIQQISINGKLGLTDICFAPLFNKFSTEKTIESCAIHSLFGFLHNNMKNGDYLETLIRCLKTPNHISCLAPYGSAIEPELVAAGAKRTDFTDATATTLTFIIENSSQTHLALTWEEEFIEFMKKWIKTEKPDFLEVSFKSEKSMEDGIKELSNIQTLTIVISYSAMFLYSVFALTKIRNLSIMMVDLKITLSFAAVFITLSSILCGFGLCSFFKVPTTFLTLQVLAFLVLAVGFDNIFMIVQVHQNRIRKRRLAVEYEVGESLGKIGPSILLTSCAEIFTFGVGIFSNIPIIRTFAIYATATLIFNFILQMTLFIIVLTLDEQRSKHNRVDVFCCIAQRKIFEKFDFVSNLEFIWSEIYVPNLMRFTVRCIVLLIFFGTFCAGIFAIPKIDIGLNEESLIPSDNYLLDYYQSKNELLNIGPPVYWMIKGDFDYSDPNIQNKICGGLECNQNSIVTQLYSASLQKETTYIQTQPPSWIDYFKEWSQNEKCCKYFEKDGSFCPNTYLFGLCKVCVFDPKNDSFQEYFRKYIPNFLQDNPSINCPKAGHALYSSGVNYRVIDENSTEITSSYFKSYYSALKSSKDHYEALNYARIIAENLTATLDVSGVNISPYSDFYIFYEQFLTIWKNTIFTVTGCLLLIFAMSWILYGFDFFSAFAIFVTVVMISVNMGGFMYIFGISLNPLSVYNLIIGMGISVKFLGHIVYFFKSSEKVGRLARATEALNHAGLWVLFAITFTKLFGIIAFLFLQPEIFQTIYFKMLLGMVLIGMLHGLVLLPVLLSFFGIR